MCHVVVSRHHPISEDSPVHLDGIMLEGKDVVREYYDLVVSPLVIFNEELAGPELVWVHDE